MYRIKMPENIYVGIYKCMYGQHGQNMHKYTYVYKGDMPCYSGLADPEVGIGNGLK